MDLNLEANISPMARLWKYNPPIYYFASKKSTQCILRDFSRKLRNLQYVKKKFENNKGNFSGSKPIICRKITFNSEKIELFFYILYRNLFYYRNLSIVKISKKNLAILGISGDIDLFGNIGIRSIWAKNDGAPLSWFKCVLTNYTTLPDIFSRIFRISREYKGQFLKPYITDLINQSYRA